MRAADALRWATRKCPPSQPRAGNNRVIKVQVRSNESLEAAMRRFKRQCNYSGIFRLAKANSWHEKRSDKRRRERRERLRTIQKATRKNDPNRRRFRRRRPAAS
jgi:small subunit ribosomal protein S21